MIDTARLNADVPNEHTIAITRDDNIIHSGMMADSRIEWDNIMLDGNHGLYTYAGKAIDGKWYRMNWAVK